MGDELKQLDVLRAVLKKAPSQLDVADLFPIFVPMSFFASGNWPGPYETLQIPGLGLTWAVLQSGQAMRYVDHRVETHWDGEGIPWREKAIENVRRRSVDSVWTHEFRREDRSIFAVAMMHSDGFGPSRLVLREALEPLFPEGYLVALPEMSCGLVLSARATDEESAKIVGLATSCFQAGTRPLVSGMYEASGLEMRRPV
jgi:hypothetical protein